MFPECHELPLESLQRVYTCSQPPRHSKELCSFTDGMSNRIVNRRHHSWAEMRNRYMADAAAVWKLGTSNSGCDRGRKEETGDWVV